MSIFHGLSAFPITPANEHGVVDTEGVMRLTTHLSGNGVDSIGFLGSTGTAALLDSLPAAQWMLGDRGYDADWFREALKEKGIKPGIPRREFRGQTVKYDKRKYKRRNRIEIMS
ncbi:hypothetical protein GCM10007866_22370 [Gluconobacter albidus]|uniref:Transposase n=1 Tax=Gluconobacter albidus TaxID=318683 RepID=A0ABQ5X270_9PROT|nr:transposase [Gluconobacter albidus NBRC 3250]GLQ69784.1 hypothetical protein GCM10007866_22370 [Gluconobacter albidus]